MQTPLEAFLSKNYAEGPFFVEHTLNTKGERVAYMACGETECFVAKLTEPGRDPLMVQEEALLVEEIALRNAGAPRPLLSLDGKLVLPFEDRFLYLYEFIDGRHPEPEDALYPQLGDLLARLHSLPLTPETHASSYRPANWLPNLSQYFRAALAEEESAEKQAALQELLAMIAQFPSFDELPQGIIHTDPYLSNILIDNNRGMFLIDWDDAGVSYPLLDVGYVLAHLTTFSALDRARLNMPGPESGPTRRADWAEAFMTAYQQVRPLTPAEQALLPWAVRFAFLYYIPNLDTGSGIVWDNYERLKLYESAE